MKIIKKILPKNTSITRYFRFKNDIFSSMELPDGRFLVQIVHTWGDGEVMDYGFEYSDRIPRRGINPLHIVRVYDKKMSNSTLRRDLNRFLEKYRKSNQERPAITAQILLKNFGRETK